MSRRSYSYLPCTLLQSTLADPRHWSYSVNNGLFDRSRAPSYPALVPHLFDYRLLQGYMQTQLADAERKPSVVDLSYHIIQWLVCLFLDNVYTGDKQQA